MLQPIFVQRNLLCVCTYHVLLLQLCVLRQLLRCRRMQLRTMIHNGTTLSILKVHFSGTSVLCCSLCIHSCLYLDVVSENSLVLAFYMHPWILILTAQNICFPGAVWRRQLFSFSLYSIFSEQFVWRPSNRAILSGTVSETSPGASLYKIPSTCGYTLTSLHLRYRFKPGERSS